MNQKELIRKLEEMGSKCDGLRTSPVKEIDDDIQSLSSDFDDLVGELEDNPLELPEKEEDD